MVSSLTRCFRKIGAQITRHNLRYRVIPIGVRSEPSPFEKGGFSTAQNPNLHRTCVPTRRAFYFEGENLAGDRDVAGL